MRTPGSRVALDELAKAVQASPDALRADLLEFYRQSSDELRMSERSLQNMLHVGVSLRNSVTREWFAEFLRWHRSKNPRADYDLEDVLPGVTSDKYKLKNRPSLPKDRFDLIKKSQKLSEENRFIYEIDKRLSGLYQLYWYSMQKKISCSGIYISRPQRGVVLIDPKKNVWAGNYFLAGGYCSIVLMRRSNTVAASIISVNLGIPESGDFSKLPGVVVRQFGSGTAPSAGRVFASRVSDGESLWEQFENASTSDQLSDEKISKSLKIGIKGEDDFEDLSFYDEIKFELDKSTSVAQFDTE